MTVKLKRKAIPDFIHNQYSTEYQPIDCLNAYNPLAGIYLLRLAIGLQKQLSVQSLNSLFTDELAELTGLTEQSAELTATKESKNTTGANDADAETPATSKSVLVKLIHRRLKQIIKKGMSVNSPLFTNLGELAKNFDLNAIDQEILVLKVLMYRYPCFKTFLNEHWPDVSDDGLYNYIHLLTVRPIADIKNSLAANSRLQKLGWLTLAPHTLDFEERLTLSPLVFNVLLQQNESVSNMLDRFFETLPPNNLRMSDSTEHLQDLDVLVPLLQASLKIISAPLFFAKAKMGSIRF